MHISHSRKPHVMSVVQHAPVSSELSPGDRGVSPLALAHVVDPGTVALVRVIPAVILRVALQTGVDASA